MAVDDGGGAELDAVVEELKARDFRMLLILGPGSSGKTRLLRRLGPVIDPTALDWQGDRAV